MKRTTYQCDFCSTYLDRDDGNGKPHISVQFNYASGWVSNHTKPGKDWKFDSWTQGRFQFCNEKCLAGHFRSLAREKS